VTAAPQPLPHCVVCGTQVASDTEKCPSCGLSRPGMRGSKVLGRQGFWFLGAMLLVVYVVVLLIVAAAR
jgi:predicted nucleic acid-binding Zn ribbon protein